MLWKKFQDSPYFLQFTQEQGYELYITDYFTVWSIIYSEKAFLAQLKECNEGLELADDQVYLQKGLYLLSNPDRVKKLNIVKENNGNTLLLSLSISIGYRFGFDCKLSKGSEELFFHKVTKMLLKTIGDLRSSECELRRLLVKKDSEIEEYKSEGGEIVLRHLKTQTFNDGEHMKKHKLYEENFGVDIPVINVLKQELKETENLEPNIKTEPKHEVFEQPSVSIINQELGGLNANLSLTVKTEPTEQVIQDAIAPILPGTSKQEDKKKSINTSAQRKRPKRFNY